MKNTITNKMLQRQITRRELVGGALAAAGVITGAPAFLRGQNLNNKLNIAMIACGGRAIANMKGDGPPPRRPWPWGRTGRRRPAIDRTHWDPCRKHYGPLRREPSGRGRRGSAVPECKEVQRFP